MNTAKEPYSLLAEIARRSVDAATGLPAQVDMAPRWSGVGFSLAGVRLVAPMGEITEVLPVPPATRLPGVKPWVRGVANVRGRLLPLFDMEAFLGLSLSASQRQSHRVMALELDEVYGGLIVGTVFGIESFAMDTFSDEIPDNVSESLKPYLSGSYLVDGERWGLFSPRKLIEDNGFFNVAA